MEMNKENIQGGNSNSGMQNEPVKSLWALVQERRKRFNCEPLPPSAPKPAADATHLITKSKESQRAVAPLEASIWGNTTRPPHVPAVLPSDKSSPNVDTPDVLGNATMPPHGPPIPPSGTSSNHVNRPDVAKASTTALKGVKRAGLKAKIPQVKKPNREHQLAGIDPMVHANSLIHVSPTREGTKENPKAPQLVEQRAERPASSQHIPEEHADLLAPGTSLESSTGLDGRVARMKRANPKTLGPPAKRPHVEKQVLQQIAHDPMNQFIESFTMAKKTSAPHSASQHNAQQLDTSLHSAQQCPDTFSGKGEGGDNLFAGLADLLPDPKHTRKAAASKMSIPPRNAGNKEQQKALAVAIASAQTAAAAACNTNIQRADVDTLKIFSKQERHPAGNFGPDRGPDVTNKKHVSNTVQKSEASSPPASKEVEQSTTKVAHVGSITNGPNLSDGAHAVPKRRGRAKKIDVDSKKENDEKTDAEATVDFQKSPRSTTIQLADKCVSLDRNLIAATHMDASLRQTAISLEQADLFREIALEQAMLPEASLVEQADLPEAIPVEPVAVESAPEPEYCGFNTSELTQLVFTNSQPESQDSAEVPESKTSKNVSPKSASVESADCSPPEAQRSKKGSSKITRAENGQSPTEARMTKKNSLKSSGVETDTKPQRSSPKSFQTQTSKSSTPSLPKDESSSVASRLNAKACTSLRPSTSITPKVLDGDLGSPMQKRRSSLCYSTHSSQISGKPSFGGALLSPCWTPQENKPTMVQVLSDDTIRENLGIIKAVLNESMFSIPGGEETRKMLLDSTPEALRCTKDQRSPDQMKVVQQLDDTFKSIEAHLENQVTEMQAEMDSDRAQLEGAHAEVQQLQEALDAKSKVDEEGAAATDSQLSPSLAQLLQCSWSELSAQSQNCKDAVLEQQKLIERKEAKLEVVLRDQSELEYWLQQGYAAFSLLRDQESVAVNLDQIPRPGKKRMSLTPSFHTPTSVSSL